MNNKTNIEWVKNPDGSQGYTFNPITGGLNHVNGLCKGGGFPCYAYKLAWGRLKQRYLANTANVAQLPDGDPKWIYRSINDPFYPRLWPERIAKYFDGHKKPRGVFVCDMGELFGDWIPEKWQEQIFTVIRAFPNDRFYLLTKQPQNLIKWSPFPDNCWVGVTATNYKMMIAALNELCQIDAKVIYLSLEPLLSWDNPYDAELLSEMFQCQQLNWLIIGAQTKPYKPPKIESVEEIVEAADKAGIPVFLKDNLAPLLKAGGWKIGEHKWITELRQELPNVK